MPRERLTLARGAGWIYLGGHDDEELRAELNQLAAILTAGTYDSPESGPGLTIAP